MIYSLRGSLIYAQPGTAVVECCGVGYKCAVSHHTYRKLTQGREANLLTHMAVREDSVDLYGFFDARELESFRLLISVNGVGPRVALALLSDNTPDSLALAVASGDAKSLTRSAGVGNKLAQRIVLELKDKLGSFDRADGSMQNLSAALEDSAIGEAAAALASLGYTASEAATALMGSDPSLTVDALIRSGLKKLSNKR